jgi:hypothetical protein
LRTNKKENMSKNGGEKEKEVGKQSLIKILKHSRSRKAFKNTIRLAL